MQNFIILGSAHVLYFVLCSTQELKIQGNLTKDNILLVYNDIDISQIFGVPEIERILDCSPTTAKELMKKLRDMEVVVEVKGDRKGKYRCIYENEV